MPSVEFIPRYENQAPLTIFDDPFIRCDIKARDHSFHKSYPVKSMTNNRGSSVEHVGWNGGTLSGLKSSSGYSNVTFSQYVTLPENSLYHVYIRMRKGPKNSGYVRLYVDGVQVDKNIYSKTKHEHWEMADLGYQYFKAGNRYVEIIVDKGCFIESIYFYKIRNFSNFNIRTDEKLVFDELDFTQNTITTPNVASVRIPLLDSYFDENNPNSTLKFDLFDEITIYTGQDRKDIKPMFGGYVTGHNIGEEEIEINCMDRMLDLDLMPLLMNFAINTKGNSDTTYRLPFFNATTIHGVAEYIASTSEYPINTSGIFYPVAFMINFSNDADFNLPCDRFTKRKDAKIGSPAPSLALGVGTVPGFAQMVFYEDRSDPYDATRYDLINFKYKAANKYPPEINFGITMHTAEQTINDAKEYTIKFTGKNVGSNLIGSVKPVLDNNWHIARINIESLFDNYVPSSNYYVSKVRIFDNLTTSQVKPDRRKYSLMYLDSIGGISSTIEPKFLSSQEAMRGTEILSEMCNDCNHEAFITYGDTRRNDVINVRPLEDEVAPYEVVAGGNMVKIEHEGYAPVGSFGNYVIRQYTYPVKKQVKQKVAYTVKQKVKGKMRNVKKYKYVTKTVTEDKLGMVTESDSNSILWYKRYGDYSYLEETNNEASARSIAKSFIRNNAWNTNGFKITIPGYTDLEPHQLLPMNLNPYRLTGTYPIKAMLHSYDRNDAPRYTLEIDVGKPSDEFRVMIGKIQDEFYRNRARIMNLNYGAQGLQRLGAVSPGGTICTYPSNF